MNYKILALLFLFFVPKLQAENFKWVELAPGLQQSTYSFGGSGVIKPEMIFFRITPSRYKLSAALATDLGHKRTDVRKLAQSESALLAINANFFDTDDKALGLVVKGGKTRQKMHNGGSLLTGVFQVKNGTPSVIHRSKYNPSGVDLALQSGPRLIANGKPLKLSSPHTKSRRSGVAISKKGELFLFVTAIPFPGVSLQKLQSVLLSPEIKAVDALNFDGGSSAQVFVKELGQDIPELYVSGGENVPVALVLKP